MLSRIVCGCPACKHRSHVIEERILASLAFDLSYDVLLRTDLVSLAHA